TYTLSHTPQQHCIQHRPIELCTRHCAYQPTVPASNKYLQKKWDQSRYEEHRRKVVKARPVVDTKGFQTPAHLHLKLKKLQLEEERLATIERDNHILSSKLSDIMRSKGLVDHRNSYPERSLNAEKRRQQLQEVNRVNQGILERITIQESEYRRQRWSPGTRTESPTSRGIRKCFFNKSQTSTRNRSQAACLNSDQANKVDSEH
ncbi:sperm axonemal maintenance protein CFAP97D1-like, partial [Acipenser ruthenus]|uniref:sperm axonemal maintenance protein CFAP97D1-like n=1 Tax=Acipenser ruthenus TaxID=7906 RepID=UPI002741B107